MADKKNDTLSESDKQRKVWKRVEKLIAQDKAEDALLLLRELDEKGLTKPHFDLQARQLTKSLNKQMPNPIIVRLLHFLETQ
jgi:hypothetical protein